MTKKIVNKKETKIDKEELMKVGVQVDEPKTKKVKDVKAETKGKEDKKVQIILEVNNELIESEGKDLYEAFDNLEVAGFIKTTGVLMIKGVPRSRRLFNVSRLKRFLGNKTFRKIIAKSMSVYVE